MGGHDLARDNKRLSKLLYDAKLRIPNACLEDVDHSAKRELDRAQVRRLGVADADKRHKRLPSK